MGLDERGKRDQKQLPYFSYEELFGRLGRRTWPTGSRRGGQNNGKVKTAFRVDPPMST